jgi:hypothetical protein
LNRKVLRLINGIGGVCALIKVRSLLFIELGT